MSSSRRWFRGRRGSESDAAHHPDAGDHPERNARRTAATHRDGLTIPGDWLPTAEYVARFPERWHPVEPVDRPQRRPAIRFGHRQADLTDGVEQTVPALGTLELPRGRLFGKPGWVVSPEDQLLPQTSWYGTHVDEMTVPARAFRVERLSGVVASLSTDNAERFYGHYLLEALPRVDLLERAGFALADIDHFVCSAPNEKLKGLWGKLGVPAERVVTPRAGVVIEGDILLAPSFPGTRRNYQPWLVSFLRARLGTPGAADRPRSRRLYLPRTTSRRITNEASLLSILEAAGFESYDPPRHRDPRGDFAAAEVVVGGSGSALADLVFCQPGTRVLELIPSDHVVAYWYTVADSGRLRYGYLVGESETHRPAGTPGPSLADFRVDEDEFREALAATLEGLPLV